MRPEVEVITTISTEAASWALVKASEQAQLLVVGTRGLGGFKSMLLGSVSQHCATHATCSTLIVREALRSPRRMTACRRGFRPYPSGDDCITIDEQRRTAERSPPCKRASATESSSIHTDWASLSATARSSRSEVQTERHRMSSAEVTTATRPSSSQGPMPASSISNTRLSDQSPHACDSEPGEGIAT